MKLFSARGLKLVLSFIIVAWGQPALLGWLGALSAFLGFALFFSIFAQLTNRQKALYSTIWFGTAQLVQLSWLTSIEFQGYYILVVYAALALLLGLQFACFTATIPSREEPSWARVIACAALWACLEWSRLFFLCGFSWNPIGLSLSYYDLSLQWAGIWGVLGLSFWVMLTNLIVLKGYRSSKRFSLAFISPLLIIAGLPYLYGFFHMSYHARKAEKHKQHVDVALVQTALLPSQKIPLTHKIEEFVPPFQQWVQIVAVLSAEDRQKIDLIVLPEAVVPLQADFPIYALAQVKDYFISLWGESALLQFPPLIAPYAGMCLKKGVEEMCVSNLFWGQLICNHFNAEMVIGLDYTDKKSGKNFNSAFYLKPNQTQIGRYDKQILLPLAEYLPFSFLKSLTMRYGIGDFFSQGKVFEVWGEGFRFSPCICYEETFSGLMRRAKNLGAQMLINLTNDNYYPQSTLHKQHLFHARLRSIENGVPLIRSCNAGISATIDSRGSIVNQLMPSSTCDVLWHRLNNYFYNTPFSVYGESGVIGLFLSIVFCYWGNQLRMKRKQKYLELKVLARLPSL